MTTSREEAFAEVVALRVKNRSLQSRQWRIERLIKAIPDRQKTLEDGIWASTDGLNGAKREKEIALASGASYEVDHLDWLLSNITRLRNRLRIVDKLIDALPERQVRVEAACEASKQALQAAEIRACAGGFNWYAAIEGYSGIGERAFREAMKGIGLVPSAFIYRGSFQRIVGVRLKKGDAPGLAQAIAAVRTVLPFYEPIDGYVLFPAFKPPSPNTDGAPFLKVPHDLSHALVNDEKFATLEDALAYMQAIFGTKPAYPKKPQTAVSDWTSSPPVAKKSAQGDDYAVRAAPPPSKPEPPEIRELRMRLASAKKHREVLLEDFQRATRRLSDYDMNIRIASERLNTLETLHHARQQNWRYLLDVPNGAGRTRQFEEAVIALGLWPGGSVRPTGQRAVDLRMARYSEHDQIEHISRSIRFLLPHYTPLPQFGGVYVGIQDHQGNEGLFLIVDRQRVSATLVTQEGRIPFRSLEDALEYVQEHFWYLEQHPEPWMSPSDTMPNDAPPSPRM